ncbi:HTH-type transcriptional activator RhaS [Zophobihabitans entericus]|uniref:HTH-type transcriptional activator RhaS n=1 Tax=Zophobihabitans entericus TaxID=1635327 RepID=A0A6G9ICL7_9GAMM|nr:HTH-type transcriptional activator RhaS [Zophobihabitans entericus]QIQ21976.1 HTH-type transcriptional activator RhaS [Zophobihabitans entericus]
MVQKLYSDDFFVSHEQAIAIEPRVPQYAYPEHFHDFNEIVIVTGGKGMHILNGKPYDLHAGMIFYIEAADHHLYENVDDLVLTNILYRHPDSFHFLNNISSLLPDRETEPDTHWCLDKRNFQQVQKVIDEMVNQRSLPAVQKESLFLQMLISLQQGRYFEQGQGKTEDRIHQLLRWLKIHFYEEIDWLQLAEKFSLSLRTLHRHMKNDTGYTPQRYLTKLRLSEAYYQLCHTDKSITHIALDCGFNDSAYFATSFKNEFELTPRDLRTKPLVQN